MTTYICDIFDLPEKVHGGDFVLKLTEGVAHPEQTLEPYVVTPQLAESFDRALDFIRGALASQSSRAAYLDGSFGAGKSHFMAVLHLLLERHTAARAKEGLEDVVTRHEQWLGGENGRGGPRFLLVPFHMLGQPSVEAAILGGYARRVRELHPEAPVPAVYLTEGLFRNARQLRQKMGDESFFAGLGETTASTSDGAGSWGQLEAGGWDAASFEAALAASPDSPDRVRLVDGLLEAYFTGYGEMVRGRREAFVSLDDGLAVISRHAQELGYDALVLFLDELVLWFATHATDQDFLNTEGPKVSKLVEAERSDRPIPVVSFVARQRDLRELVGESVTGAEKLGFSDVLQWWEARFAKIILEDRNLPEIAARRLLRPKNEAARQKLEAAWRDTEKIRAEVFDVLATPTADRATFRKVYPFSPALIEALIAVSSVLQRERTALKVMLQILVEQKETLALGQIVPVGDLFDVIASGDEPFTEGLRQHFENAKKLEIQKLRPLLEEEHGMSREEWRQLPPENPRARAFRADDRLLKTLLLAALVPEAEVLRRLDATRLVALNHGSVTSLIAGRERQIAVERLGRWASRVGEIKLSGPENDPILSLELSGVDTKSILANAQSIDNPGNRRRKIRELLFSELGIAEDDGLFYEHEISWRGTRRKFQVIFANVRELTGESFATRGEQRKAVIDFPFDEGGHTPADDVARLDRFLAEGASARTLVWLPTFLGSATQRELGTLVCLDEVLKSDEAFRRHASHLSPQDQAQARELLRNQRDHLRFRLLGILEGAYGAAAPVKGSLDEAHAPERHHFSLTPGGVLEPPVGSNLRQAFEHLLDQVLRAQYPAHPELATELRPHVLRKVYGEAARAARTKDGRVMVEKSLRGSMREVAVPLRLGEMGETHFVLGRHWYEHFTHGFEGTPTVGRLRELLDEPSPMGLPRDVQSLVILLFAEQANRSFVLHGGPFEPRVEPRLEDLPDEAELRKAVLPTAAVWEQAVERAGKIFGLTASRLHNVGNVASLAVRLAERAREARENAREVYERLADLHRDFALDAAASARLRTARALAELVDAILESEEKACVEVLAKAPLATSAAAMGTALERLAANRAALENTRFELFESVDRLEGTAAVREGLGGALATDEYALALGPRLETLVGEAVELLSAAAGAAAPGTVAPGMAEETRAAATIETPEEAGGAPAPTVVEQGARRGLAAAAAQELFASLGERLAADEELRLDLSFALVRTPPRGGDDG